MEGSYFASNYIRFQLTIPVYHYFTLMRVFLTSVSWWFLTGVCVTASLLKSPGLFSVFWLILIMLQAGWSLFFFLFLSLLVPLLILWVLIQLQLVSLSPSCSIDFLVLEQGLDIYLSFCFLLILLSGLKNKERMVTAANNSNINKTRWTKNRKLLYSGSYHVTFSVAGV